LENQAKRHYRAAGRNLARFAADLRRLQDGEAHLTRGFSSFGAYAEHTFDGLTAANAKKISTQGAVLLALEEHGRISLDAQTSQLPGATGLRALAAVLGQHGENTMLAVYDKAAALRPGRAVVDTTVNLAVRGMLTPPVELQAPPSLPAAHEQPPDAGDQAHDVDEDLDDDPDEDPEAVHELHDRSSRSAEPSTTSAPSPPNSQRFAADEKPNASLPTSSKRSTNSPTPSPPQSPPSRSTDRGLARGRGPVVAQTPRRRLPAAIGQCRRKAQKIVLFAGDSCGSSPVAVFVGAACHAGGRGFESRRSRSRRSP
jgi:hypothetical protein